MGKLYIVGPITDMRREVSLRALRILKESSLIVVLGTDSVPEWLLQEEGCPPLIELDRVETISTLLTALHTGDVAWLIRRLAELDSRARRFLCLLIEQGIEPFSVPGPCNAIAGLTVSGLATDSLTYLGLLEVSSERRSLLQSVAGELLTLVCEFAADDLVDTRRDVLACLGDRRVMLYGRCRTWRGRISQVDEWPATERLTLVIGGAEQAGQWSRQRVGDEIAALLSTGASPRDVAREIARQSGWPRKKVYRLILSICREG
jgi:16S rRNA (cytidine1402-2'-O)-methyltransferase